MGEIGPIMRAAGASKKSGLPIELSKFHSCHSKDVMRRCRTTRHETLRNAALFSFSMTVSDEIYILVWKHSIHTRRHISSLFATYCSVMTSRCTSRGTFPRDAQRVC